MNVHIYGCFQLINDFFLCNLKSIKRLFLWYILKERAGEIQMDTMKMN